MHRIHDFIITDKAEIASMFRPFDSSLTILDFSLMKESMSNTGYAVTTNAGKYSLKLYSNTTDKPETAALTYLKNKKTCLRYSFMTEAGGGVRSLTRLRNFSTAIRSCNICGKA